MPQAAPPPQKTLPQPLPRQSGPTSAETWFCLFEDKRFSIGAGVCVSNQLLQVCAAPDKDHSNTWWWAHPEPLCNSGANPGLPPR
jgi:hypothetical protein